MDNIFLKIVRGEVAVEAVYEDEHVIAFNDIAPQAPVHVLVIPKKPVINALALEPGDAELAGRVLLACKAVAEKMGIANSGCRIVLNCGEDAGQSVGQLHAHVLGGRALGWPPG